MRRVLRRIAAPILSRRTRIVLGAVVDDNYLGRSAKIVDARHRVPLEFGAHECDSAQPVHQGVGERGQQQPELVGLEPMAARARAEQIELRLLDPVLGLAARAVQLVVQHSGLGFEVGYHEARIHALRAVLEAGDDPPLAIPAGRRVMERADLALLGAGALVRLAHRHLYHRDGSIQSAVACQPDQVTDARALAPANEILSAEPRVGAHDDARLGLTCPAFFKPIVPGKWLRVDEGAVFDAAA